jgi:hypothetical protein
LFGREIGTQETKSTGKHTSRSPDITFFTDIWVRDHERNDIPGNILLLWGWKQEEWGSREIRSTCHSFGNLFSIPKFFSAKGD